MLRLEIADDGCRFGPVSTEGVGGFGLVSMRERADRFGGEPLIHSERGGGTEVMGLLQYRSIHPDHWETEHHE